MIKILCSNGKHFELTIANMVFQLFDEEEIIAAGDRVNLWSQLGGVDENPPSPLENDLSIFKDSAEVLRTATTGDYIQSASGEIKFSDVVGNSWKLKIIPIELYEGGRNFTFSLVPWSKMGRLYNFTPSFLNFSFSGNFIFLENNTLRIGGDMNHSRLMISPTKVSGDIKFVGEKENFNITHPMIPHEYSGKISDGIVLFPTRITIKGCCLEAWTFENNKKEIIGTLPFSAIEGELDIETSEGAQYKIVPEKICSSYFFIMLQIFPDGTKNILMGSIGNQLRFSCLHVPEAEDPRGYKPEFKLIGIEQENSGAVIPLR